MMNSTLHRLGIALIFLAPQLFAQIPSAESIYRSIELRDEYSSKASWIITDASLVRSVLSRLLAGGALLDSNGQALGDPLQSIVGRLVSSNALTISCTRRQYDDHLERLTVLTPSDPSVSRQIAPVEDWVYMNDVLGSELYSLVRSKRYSWSGTTGDEFDAKQRFTYDVYLSALNPHAMIWQTTREQLHDNSVQDAAMLERWMVSVWGNLGFDCLDLPFWFKGTGAAGLQVSYVDDAFAPDRDYERYAIRIGVEEPVNFSVRTTTPSSASSPFKERRLQGSGTGVFLGATWTPNGHWPRQGQHLTLGMESSLAISERQSYGSGIPPEFYTIRNYLSISARLHHVGLLQFGAGLTWHDLHYRTPPDMPSGGIRKISDNFIPSLEVGVAHDGGLLQYAVNVRVDYTLGGGYGFFMITSQMMISNTLGIDFRYFKALNSASLPVWHYDNYIAISPVIRINY